MTVVDFLVLFGFVLFHIICIFFHLLYLFFVRIEDADSKTLWYAWINIKVHFHTLLIQTHLSIISSHSSSHLISVIPQGRLELNQQVFFYGGSQQIKGAQLEPGEHPSSSALPGIHLDFILSAVSFCAFLCASLNVHNGL